METQHIIYFNNIEASHCQTQINSRLNEAAVWHNVTKWAGLSEALETGTSLLAVHSDMLLNGAIAKPAEFMDAVTTITKLMPCRKDLHVAVVINKETPAKFVRELQQSSCQGLLLDINYYSLDEVMVAINAFINHIPYWPKNIIEDLPGSTKKENKNSNISLTTRQEQVLQLVQERGASNKMIAKTLDITESTVKLHMGAILKKFNVKSRTQLVAFNKH